jgi:hypothetical protein
LFSLVLPTVAGGGMANILTLIKNINFDVLNSGNEQCLVNVRNEFGYRQFLFSCVFQQLLGAEWQII